MSEREREAFEKWHVMDFGYLDIIPENRAPKNLQDRWMAQIHRREGYHAALADQSAPGPCGIEGHRVSDCDECKHEKTGLVVLMCRLCAEYERGRVKALDAAAKAQCRDCKNGEGVKLVMDSGQPYYYHDVTTRCEATPIHRLKEGA